MDGKNLTTAPLRALIWLYRHTFSYVLGGRCRFQPTCSVYAGESLKRHGLVKGNWLALKRIARCSPWGGHGYDPVPEITENNEK